MARAPGAGGLAPGGHAGNGSEERLLTANSGARDYYYETEYNNRGAGAVGLRVETKGSKIVDRMNQSAWH